MFADYFGFGNVFAGTREVPIAHQSFTYAKIKSLHYTHDEAETYRKAYHFLRSALTSEVDRGIFLRAHSPKAWRNFESWHNPKCIATIQSLHKRFQTFSVKPGQNPLITLIDVEEVTA